MRSRIVGTGSYLPAGLLTNSDLEKRMDTSDAWIRERTGIERRHIVAPGETTVDMAEHAARNALAAAGREAREVDLIIVGTCTPDLIFPNAGVMLQGRLGNLGCPALSVEAACSGFIYALSMADKFIRAGESKLALVVGSESLSKITNMNDRGTAILFGDGAGAVLLAPDTEPGILSTHLHADGSYLELLRCTGGVSAGLHPEGDFIRMAGSEVFKVAVTMLGRAVDEALEANGVAKEALTWLVPHQANIRIIQATAKKLGMPMERVIVTVADHGNTSTASVPLALDVGVRDGRIKRGDLLLLEAFGGGFTWGSALVRY
ncbi:MAG TPA: beta-ketoacyl-ACP synthase III [Steroidobacteraceae bacterium]|nr:beta-ketoacyl-ACP synthase III [Steroidobacteraceae bacterium]